MPTYEYKCKCGEHVECDSPMSKIKKTVKCPKCGGRATRVFSLPNFKCVYSYMERVNGNPRVNRSKGWK